MRPSQAKQELEKIMNQKTVRISRLQKVLSVLDYRELEQKYINLSKNIKGHKKTINRKKKKIYNQRREISRLRGMKNE